MIARLRQEGLARQTPVMLLTALDLDRESVRRAYALGAVDYITKPIDSDLLRWRGGALVSLYRRGAELKKRGAMIAQKDPFRGNASDSIGLGLFIVKEILVAHGGTGSVRSSIEQGTTF